MKLNVLMLLFVVLISSLLGASQGGSLSEYFYKHTCGEAETIVKKATEKHVASNPAVPAQLLRMHFHDCFVRGCDGSVLLNSKKKNAEKDAGPNQSLLGFDVIDDIKAQVEKKCPGVVSCADILALAARDSVSYAFKKSMWEVPTGRRDGKVSRSSEVQQNIPAPFFNFNQLKQNFASKGLNVHDLVVLSGGHTIGVSHCNGFSNRLYNFTGKGDQDPSLDKKYAQQLKSKCPPRDRKTTVAMDPGSGSALKFDSSYYDVVIKKKGLFTSDSTLLTNNVARNTVQKLVHQNDFFTEFALSMKKMGAIQVLTGTAGEIRKKCWAVNSN
ncbi:peroxidase 3-like [Humulus lupulus]|uniref:peroxidase 3-like n=1 Tax=Humulus lupulus TaxID=3486 RepID=UPI002B404AEB|nr:peroxidase 3-like [Humulus lupulus]